jgi:hypothetical protein
MYGNDTNLRPFFIDLIQKKLFWNLEKNFYFRGENIVTLWALHGRWQLLQKYLLLSSKVSGWTNESSASSFCFNSILNYYKIQDFFLFLCCQHLQHSQMLSRSRTVEYKVECLEIRPRGRSRCYTVNKNHKWK